MSSMAVDGLATSPETGPEQPPASPGLALAESPPAAQAERMHDAAQGPLGCLKRPGSVGLRGRR